MREDLRENAERLAAEAGLQIELIRKLKAFRKEDRIKEILNKRGDHPGLVHIISAMESCSSFPPWHDKSTHRTSLNSTSGRCLHCYFIDAHFDLRYMRVPTWAPFRLQTDFNGPSWPARQLLQGALKRDPIHRNLVGLDASSFSAPLPSLPP